MDEAKLVCHLEGKIDGVVHVCNRAEGHAPPHVMELFKRDRPAEPAGIPTGPQFVVTWAEDRVGTAGRGKNTVPVRVIEGHIDTAVLASPPDPSAEEMRGLLDAALNAAFQEGVSDDGGDEWGPATAAARDAILRAIAPSPSAPWRPRARTPQRRRR